MANTCREAVEEVFAAEKGVLDTAQVIDRIYKRYPDRPWKPNAISAHLIGLSVNHSSSVHHPTLRKHGFLFSLGKSVGNIKALIGARQPSVPRPRSCWPLVQPNRAAQRSLGRIDFPIRRFLIFAR